MNQLDYKINSEGNHFELCGDEHMKMGSENSDFWRVMVDDGYYREVMIPSHLQNGIVTCVNKETIKVTYNHLVDLTGKEYDIIFSVFISKKQSELEFFSNIENNSDFRVNEVQLPFLDFSCVCQEDTKKDVLYRSRGMGERIYNPWSVLEREHTEYMSADYKEVWSPLLYPRPSTMAWFGLQSGDKFLYLGRHDQQGHICTFNCGISPRNSKNRLLFSICHYPLAVKGEIIKTARCIVALLNGTWKDGVKKYRTWADNTWFMVKKKPDWIKTFTGWQRIILRHQYGEIFWKYKDLPKVYEDGMKYGIDTLMVFGWWKGRFDNGYPLYEPDDELGGKDELKKAIKAIQEQGGRVILYTNGVLMDVKSQFYHENKGFCARIDIDGNPYLDHYQFSNQGTVLRTFGYKTFAEACQGAKKWKDQLVHNGKVKLEYQPDSIFFDQIGGHHNFLCFNTKHEHGNRGDLDPEYRIGSFKELGSLLKENQALGTETTVDIFTPYIDYHHGCDFGNWYEQNVFPALYLSAFPETIITNRFIHDERKDYKLQLNYSFVFGFRFDVCLYRGRLIDMSSLRNYSNQVKYLLGLKEKYHRFFYPTHFVDSKIMELPQPLLQATYQYDREYLIIILNCSKDKKQIDYQNVSYTINGEDFVCILDKEK